MKRQLEVDEETRGLVGLLDPLTTVVSAAAAAILSARSGRLAVHAKPDDSPVTAADCAAEAAILEGIAGLLPGVSIVSEEAAGHAAPQALSAQFFLVDPLDGTRELVAGRDEFTINVALVCEGVPRLGIVAAPVQGLLWRGIAGVGAERLQFAPGTSGTAPRQGIAIRARPCPTSGLIAAISRSHLDPLTEAFLANLPIAQRVACGSALKFCQIAQGAADVYPRFSTTCEWDVAAGHALLVAAGGSISAPDGSPLEYGRISANFRVPAFIAWGARERGVV
ncbi:MAG: 3'(2'),5'-bisphosphate nucleotidase CysQ [Xanthobacteraceae bacterium]